eukprot:11240469-Alexandrium_andersonii.AAC.1
MIACVCPCAWAKGPVSVQERSSPAKTQHRASKHVEEHPEKRGQTQTTTDAMETQTHACAHGRGNTCALKAVL